MAAGRLSPPMGLRFSRASLRPGRTAVPPVGDAGVLVGRPRRAEEDLEPLGLPVAAAAASAIRSCVMGEAKLTLLERPLRPRLLLLLLRPLLRSGDRLVAAAGARG